MRILALLVAAAGADDDAAQRRLWAWATAQGADVSRIASRHFPGHGRGLAAPACEDGCADLLFFLPPSVLMSCADLVASDSFQLALGITNVDCNAADFDAGFSADNRLNVLGAFLAHEAAYHASSYASRRLAAVAGDNLEFASMVAGAFRRGNASLDVDRCRRVALWALFTVLNRSVELGGRLGYSLVPFWDIINHGAPRHSRRFVTLRYDDGSVEYFQDGYRGGELFHNYSFQSACPMDWVTTYGFVPEDLVAASAAPPDDNAENALGVWAPGCSDVVASRPSVRFESGVKRKYKFLSALEQINHDCVYNLKPSSASPGVACSAAYWAIPYASGGGGPVLVSKIDAVGKMEPTEAPQRVCCSAGAACCLWDVASQKKIAGTSVDAAVHAVEWSYDGATYLASCRDRTLRLFDARTGAEGWRCEPHGGSRAFTALWGGPGHAVLSAGSAQRGGREVCLLDARKASEGPVFRKLVDAQTGELMPVYDEDSSVLWVWGRGDTSAKHYEVDAARRRRRRSTRARTGAGVRRGPHCGVCALPKSACDVMALEVIKFLRLTTTTVETVGFSVPRTAELKEYFNDDLFRETRAHVLNTELVNDRLSTEKQERDNDDAAMDNLSRLATQYEKFNVNRSMGAKPGVDAQVVDGGEVSDSEWDD
ncbi:hypothetical protein JL720_9004 [Aureococcus anophagefferens]|nr:hypothetical protein JL720_9004 [Aureococcus anophagefferens]